MFRNSSFVSDGLTGFKDACLSVFPKAMHQSCWVHISRNVARLVRAKDRKEILDMLKSVYQSKTEEEANLKLESFIGSVSKRYPKAVSYTHLDVYKRQVLYRIRYQSINGMILIN